MKAKLLKLKKSMLYHLNNLSKLSIYILIYGLLLCTIYMLINTVLFTIDLNINSLAAMYNYYEVFQHIFMSVLLIIGGALLFDFVIKTDKKDKE